MKLTREGSFLVVVDIQERFIPAIHEGDRMVRGAGALARFARRLEVPVLATEQNPGKLGATVPPVAAHLDPARTWPKMTLSCCGEGPFPDAVKSLGRSQAVVCGIETQVCVLQTCLDLMERGVEVHLPLDALGSRSPLEKETALRRLEAQGARVGTVESIVFQWLARAGTPEFREFQAYLKENSHGR